MIGDDYEITPPDDDDMDEAQRTGSYLPSPEEIHAGRRAIQSTWDDATRRERWGFAHGMNVAETNDVLQASIPEHRLRDLGLHPADTWED